LKCNDIIALSESWTDVNFDSDLCNFTFYNFYGKFRQRNAKRNSGGTVLYIRDSILPGVSIVKNEYDTLIWLKLDKTFFNFQSDIYLCCLYLWPHDSPVSRIVDVDLFDVISEDVLYFEQLGSVLLSGDWNARVGKKIDFIDCDANVSNIDDYEY